MILVSGANGFIGSNLCELLIRKGHKVRGLVRTTSSLDFLNGINVELCIGDITNPASLDAALKGVTTVVHVAGLAADWGPYRDFYSINVEGTQNLAKAAYAAGVRRFVHISTVAIHGFSGFRYGDETLPTPRTIFPYCETKKLAEEWLVKFTQNLSMELVVIRPGNVFGPKDHTFTEKYAKALQQGKIGYIRQGKSWTCLTYIENLVEAIVLACFEPAAKGHAFIVTDGLETNWRKFTAKLAGALGMPIPKVSIPLWLGYGAAWFMESIYKRLGFLKPPLLTRFRIMNGGRDYHFSIRKAREILKFKPHVGLDEAIHRTAEWYATK